MSRVTAPVSKLSRAAIASSNAAARSSPLLDSTAHAHHGGVALMPKYAELLGNHHGEHSDSSRGIATAHRPTPQPSIANRTKPLMQSFSTASPSAAPSKNLDATIMPIMGDVQAQQVSPRVPLTPDHHGAHRAPYADLGPATADTAAPHVTIVAANPDTVLPGTPLRQVGDFGLDGVELKFAHEAKAAQKDEDQSTLLSDIWRGMMDDVFGPKKNASR